MINSITLTFYRPESGERERIKVDNPATTESDRVELMKFLLQAMSTFQIDVGLDVSMAPVNGPMEEILYKIKKLNQRIQPETGTGKLLSARERDVLGLIVKGFTNKEIAERLFISTETVKSHRKHILQKTNCRNSAALASFIVASNAL